MTDKTDKKLEELINKVQLQEMMDPAEDSINSEEEDEEEDEEMDGMETLDVGALMESLFTEPKKNRNAVEILCEIKRNLEVHNKLFLKLIQIVEKQKITSP